MTTPDEKLQFQVEVPARAVRDAARRALDNMMASYEFRNHVAAAVSAFVATPDADVVVARVIREEFEVVAREEAARSARREARAKVAAARAATKGAPLFPPSPAET